MMATHPAPSRREALGLKFPYDWSKGALSDDLLIRLVLERFIFHDVVVVCFRFGFDRVEAIHSKMHSATIQHELDTLKSIRIGLHEQ